MLICKSGDGLFVVAGPRCSSANGSIEYPEFIAPYLEEKPAVSYISFRLRTLLKIEKIISINTYSLAGADLLQSMKKGTLTHAFQENDSWIER